MPSYPVLFPLPRMSSPLCCPSCPALGSFTGSLSLSYRSYSHVLLYLLLLTSLMALSHRHLHQVVSSLRAEIVSYLISFSTSINRVCIVTRHRIEFWKKKKKHIISFICPENKEMPSVWLKCRTCVGHKGDKPGWVYWLMHLLNLFG